MSTLVEHLPPDPGSGGGIEAAIARLMPRVMIACVAVLGVIWWMAAQPPPGPGWDDPNAPPQAQPGIAPTPYVDPRRSRRQQHPTQSSLCSGCTAIDCGDCVSGIDCGDCVDCGDCMSNLDCGDCSGIDCSCAVVGSSAVAVAPAPSSLTSPAFPDEAAMARSVSLRRVKHLAGPGGFLLPLLVLIAWRRRVRR